ncbi:MAG: SUMF1/EgtB/PvdO family nonheme iron enzyme [Cyclobacteriaceae bacterium]
MKSHYLLLILLFAFACITQEKKSKVEELPSTTTESAIPEQTTPKTVEKKVASTEGMVYFEGGTITIGSDDGQPDQQPQFDKNIDPFHLDKNLVTVAEFREFILQTNFKTEADKFGDSGVFDFTNGQWTLVKGANWEYPLGPGQPKAQDTHPVTHISWNDASAYAEWVGKRLPTEFEWEYAAKNGQSDAAKYAWGDQVVVKGRYKANVWQGASVTQPEKLDGFLYTSPVGTYGEHASGLTDMGGNVWQWCSNTYEGYPGSPTAGRGNPNEKSTRGGSFMYDQAGEESFTTTFRSKNTIDTSLFNTGFRCAL